MAAVGTANSSAFGRGFLSPRLHRALHRALALSGCLVHHLQAEPCL